LFESFLKMMPEKREQIKIGLLAVIALALLWQTWQKFSGSNSSSPEVPAVVNQQQGLPQQGTPTVPGQQGSAPLSQPVPTPKTKTPYPPYKGGLSTVFTPPIIQPTPTQQTQPFEWSEEEYNYNPQKVQQVDMGDSRYYWQPQTVVYYQSAPFCYYCGVYHNSPCSYGRISFHLGLGWYYDYNYRATYYDGYSGYRNSQNCGSPYGYSYNQYSRNNSRNNGAGASYNLTNSNSVVSYTNGNCNSGTGRDNNTRPTNTYYGPRR